MDYCPTCSTMTIKDGTCRGCKRDFRVRIFRPGANRNMFNDLPKVKEANPFRIGYEFRDSGWRKECGFTTRRKWG